MIDGGFPQGQGFAQGCRIWIVSPAVLPICQIPEAIMQLYSLPNYEFGRGLSTKTGPRSSESLHMR